MSENLQPTEQDFTEILYQAKGARAGLLIQTSDPAKCRAKLYQVRKKLGDPALVMLQFRLCHLPDGNLAITKGQAPAAVPEQLALADSPQEAEL